MKKTINKVAIALSIGLILSANSLGIIDLSIELADKIDSIS